MANTPLYHDAVGLLKSMISIPSFSKEEDEVSVAVEEFLKVKGVEVHRKQNNIWAKNKNFNPSLPTILLNSHTDTVKPNPAYTRDPFESTEENGKLYGLGSNDAGGCLVSLIAAFLHFYERKDLPWNLILAATAEEEISGKNGVEALLPELGKIDCAIVGEPTLGQLAIAEKGLMVVDFEAIGVAGHAARNEGENAIYKAIQDIEFLRTYAFPKSSPFLGPVKVSVTQIQAGSQHNVVPASCTFVADVRLNECYSHEEILDFFSQNLKSKGVARGTRIRSSIIPESHPLVQAGLKMGRTSYGSPTTSDKALMSFPALKFGPGDSARSHSADEFIWLYEIEQGIDDYIQILNNLFSK